VFAGEQIDFALVQKKYADRLYPHGGGYCGPEKEKISI
jgi:hypothetical protein